MVKTSNRYLTLLTYNNKVPFCIKFAYKWGINTISECLGAKFLLTNVTQTKAVSGYKSHEIWNIYLVKYNKYVNTINSQWFY